MLSTYDQSIPVTSVTEVSNLLVEKWGDDEKYQSECEGDKKNIKDLKRDARLWDSIT